MSTYDDAALRFRGKIFTGAYHVDCLKDCIECPDWPESWDAISYIIDGEKEPVEFGRVGRQGEFVPYSYLDQQVRTEWYIKEGAR